MIELVKLGNEEDAVVSKPELPSTFINVGSFSTDSGSIDVDADLQLPYTCQQACAVKFGRTPTDYFGSIQPDSITDTCFAYTVLSMTSPADATTTLGVTIVPDTYYLSKCTSFASAVGCTSTLIPQPNTKMVNGNILPSLVNYCFRDELPPSTPATTINNTPVLFPTTMISPSANKPKPAPTIKPTPDK